MGFFDKLLNGDKKEQVQQPVYNPNLTQYQQMMLAYQQRFGNLPANYGSVVTNQEAIMYGEHEKRLAKNEILNIITNSIMQAYGVAINQIEKIDECPDQLRHACYESALADKGNGIHYIKPVPLTVPVTNLSMTTIHSYFCPCCGKLFISDDELSIY